jgi:D-3-phosphoglycerate dehydrogenase / 2-oxoglutarate reductase
VTKVVVLDSLFASLDLEEKAARERGAALVRWDGDRHSLADADVVAHVRTRVDAELLAAMPRCRVVTRFGSGVDTVERSAAEAAGVRVVTVRDYCVPELTTHTLALAFSLVRRLAETAVRLDSSWGEVATATSLRRHGTATVVGVGSVGCAVAAALRSLGYEVLAVTRHACAAARAVGAEVVGLADGLAAADLVFLHTALDDSTRNLLDARRLALMRPGAILTNTARLALVDEAAVADSLDEGRLGGLALDAHLPPSSPLRRFAHDPRVVVTPHIGWYSEDSAAILRRAAIANALAALAEAEETVVSS